MPILGPVLSEKNANRKEFQSLSLDETGSCEPVSWATSLVPLLFDRAEATPR